MDRDTVIRLARESGLWEILTRYTNVFAGKNAKPEELIWSDLERFAALVAAHERNKIAAWMIGRGYATGHGDTTEDLLTELEWQIKEREREACAKVCDEADKDSDWPTAANCAAAIRSRNEAR